MKNIKNALNSIPTLFDYINNVNNVIDNDKLFCSLFRSNNDKLINEETFRTAFNNLHKLNKQFIIGFKNDRTELYEMLINSLISELNVDRSIILEELINFGIISPNALAQNIINNINKLKSANINIDFITDFDIDYINDKYNKWKSSNNYIKGTSINNKVDNCFFVYNCDDPINSAQILTYPIIKYKNKLDTYNYLNSIKMDWSNNLGINFYNARIISEDNYYKKIKEELSLNITFSDTLYFNSLKNKLK